MEVILNKDVEKIGKSGDVVRIKDGFARNFLIPRGLALPVTEANLKKIEQAKTRDQLSLEKARKAAEEIKDRLSGLSLTIPVLTQEEDKLYGSITSLELVRALKEEGFDIDKNALAMDEPIKALGIYEIPVRLHPDVSANIKVWIVKK